jgi:hypothetical protein
MGRALGRRVIYKPSTMHAFSKAAIAFGMAPFELSSVRYYLEELAGGTFATGTPTDHVQELTGRPADDFDTVARRYFAEPSLIMPGMRTGSKLEAFAFLLRMMFARVPDLNRWEEAQDLPRLTRPMLAHENPEWRAHAEARRLYLLPDVVSPPKAIGQDGPIRPAYDTSA